MCGPVPARNGAHFSIKSLLNFSRRYRSLTARVGFITIDHNVTRAGSLHALQIRQWHPEQCACIRVACTKISTLSMLLYTVRWPSSTLPVCSSHHTTPGRHWAAHLPLAAAFMALALAHRAKRHRGWPPLATGSARATSTAATGASRRARAETAAAGAARLLE